MSDDILGIVLSVCMVIITITLVIISCYLENISKDIGVLTNNCISIDGEIYCERKGE